MIVRDDEPAGTWLAIGQASHAWLSGQLARAWGSPRFAPPEPREPVCLAATQHDVGMAAWDRRPALDPGTGRAMAFTAMPRRVHLALWSRAPELVESQSRYAALLISLHGTTLYTDRLKPGDDDPAVRGYVDAQRAYQASLMDRLGATPAAVDVNRRLMFCWDALSLALCAGWPVRELPAVADRAAEPVSIRWMPDEAGGALDPWPFAVQELEVQAEGRRLEGAFEDEAALHAALDAAPSVRLAWRLRPVAASPRPIAG